MAIPRDVSADLFDVIHLVSTSLDIDAKVIVPEDRSIPDFFVVLFEPLARSKRSKLEKAISIEALLVLCEAIEHLGCAL